MIILKKMQSLALFLGLIIGSTAFAQTDSKVSDTELKQFVTAFQDVQMESQKAQQKMMGVIEEEGMEVARFSEIQKAKSNPNAEVSASEAELTAYNTIITEIEAMQPAIEAKMEGHVKASGLALERYQAIATRLQTDTQLQERIRAVMQ
jgi:hypothetical protein